MQDGRPLGVGFEPLPHVPAHGQDLAVARRLDRVHRALGDHGGVAVSAEGGDGEGAGQGDRAPVVAIIEDRDEVVSIVQRVAGRGLVVGEKQVSHDGEATPPSMDGLRRGRVHGATAREAAKLSMMRAPDGIHADLTRSDTLRHNPPMTLNARSLSAREANRTAGMMMPGRVALCCRMCR